MTMVLITLVADQFPIDLMTIAQCICIARYVNIDLTAQREKRD